MAGHGPATDWGEDKATAYKERLGIYLFIWSSAFVHMLL
jgi:hypothetical protein